MTTEIHDLLDLSFTAMNTYQTLWTIYITGVLGVLAYVAAAPHSNRSVIVRCILAIGFTVFAWTNWGGLTSVLKQRISIREVAMAKINALPDGPEKDSLKTVASPSGADEDTVKKVTNICRAGYALVMSVIVLLPSPLFYISSLRSRRKNGEPSPLPQLSVTYDRSTRQWKTTEAYKLDLSTLPNPPKGLDMDYTFRIPKRLPV